MKRKVHSIGPSTLMTSLPSCWVKRLNIKKGSELEITEDGNRLILSNDSKPLEKSTTIELPDNNSFITAYMILIPYVAGYDEINVIYKNSNNIEEIKNIIKNNLIGYEIVELFDKTCKLKNIATPLQKEFLPMFERLLNILCSYSEEILEHAKKGSFNTQYIMQQETIGDKINYWCRRVINLQSQKWNGLNNLQLYRVLGLIEELMDQYRVFYKELSQDEALTKSKILVKSLETTNKVIIQTANLIRKKDRCLQDLKKYKSTYDKILYSKEFKKTDYKNKYLLSFLVAIIREAIHIVCEELNYSE